MLPPSPKERFIASEPAREHADLVLTANFVAAADATLLHLVDTMPETVDPALALASYQRLVGARTFLRTLQGIADPAKAPPRRDPGDNLSHR